MMSFFPGSFCAPSQSPAAGLNSYAPLFRLLEDYDNYSREAKTAPSSAAPSRQRARQTRPKPATFKPAFDILETEHGYQLYGALPGLARENVNLEFTEPQTLVISGRVERNYDSAATNTNNTTTNTDNDNESAVSDSPATEDFTEIKKPRSNSYQATVEDDPEDEAASPKMEVAAPALQSQEVVAQAQTQHPAQDGPKYHLLERSIGEFSRAFSFPARVDYDGVTASLENGILAVTVPKAKAMSKKIEIRV